MPRKKKTSGKYQTTSAGGARNVETGFGGPRGTTFEGAWRDLAEAYGGVEALAERIGVSRSTLHRWAVGGDNVRGPARAVVGLLAAQKSLSNPLDGQ